MNRISGRAGETEPWVFCQHTSRVTVWVIAVMPAGSGVESCMLGALACSKDISLIDVNGSTHCAMHVSAVRSCCTNTAILTIARQCQQVLLVVL